MASSGERIHDAHLTRSYHQFKVQLSQYWTDSLQVGTDEDLQDRGIGLELSHLSSSKPQSGHGDDRWVTKLPQQSVGRS